MQPAVGPAPARRIVVVRRPLQAPEQNQGGLLIPPLPQQIPPNQNPVHLQPIQPQPHQQQQQQQQQLPPQPQPPQPPVVPLDLLNQINHQQQELLRRQEAMEQLPRVLEAEPDIVPPLPDDLPPLNALQAWQANWQQRHLQHLQPFLAAPPPPPPARQVSVLPSPPGAIRSWEQETASEKDKRHSKYKKMSESSGSDKRAISQQASAMMNSVLNQEKVILFLRSLDIDDDEDQVKQLAETIDSLQESRQELVAHFEFLGVAYDFG